jgi:ribosome biogenesis GTPase A
MNRLQIQWYPGHMAKGKRNLSEQLKLVDMVIEVLDARIPYSSANPDFNQLLGKKPRLVILNKADLADPGYTKEWIRHFKTLGIEALGIDSKSQRGTAQLVKIVAKFGESKISPKKTLLPRALRAIVVGIPNVGKSSLINSLVKKNMARTGDKPGVTKGRQWIRVLPNLELLDTPGLLWPKFESAQVGFNLAVTGAINDQVFDLTEVATKFLDLMKTDYPAKLFAKYNLTSIKEEKLELLKELGSKRGFLQYGGTVDLEKTALALLRDFRSGKLGRITLEKPLDIIK